MIMTKLENWMVDDMTGKQVRYLSPVPANSPTPEIVELYTQVRREFQLVPPLTLFSPSAELFDGVWRVLRESLIIDGSVQRSTLEAVSAAVSSINACPYCVDAHSGMLHATSRHDVVDSLYANDMSLIQDDETRRIVQWALATKTPGAAILESPPFTVDQAPEIIGTAMVFHFINRMVSVFLSTSPMPVAFESITLRKIAVRIFGATMAKKIVNREATNEPLGDSASLEHMPEDLKWALPCKSIALAFSHFSELMVQQEAQYIPLSVANIVHKQLDLWLGEDMPMGNGWVDRLTDDLSGADKQIAKLALLAALAPYRVDDTVVSEFQAECPGDNALLAVTAWASFAAVRKVGTWMWQP
ncbi:hypothetical protein MNBD_GAMMA11-2116 [hydrothermal vent metagenome]|uniref:Uncharacterized protein n=1 Tax=hydrothermal vent metagenome TaxID=652676 RepID=A0A3B0Y945_9ZZZZ